MSTALLRQSLELFGYTSQEKRKKQRRKRSKDSELAVTNSQILSKTIEAKSASKQKKLTVHKAKQYLQEQTDPVEENVEKLLQFSNTKTRKEVTQKILNAVSKKQLKAKKEKPAKKEQTSVLTEEDMKLILENYEGL